MDPYGISKHGNVACDAFGSYTGNRHMNFGEQGREGRDWMHTIGICNSEFKDNLNLIWDLLLVKLFFGVNINFLCQ